MEHEIGTLTLDKETEALAHRIAAIKNEPVQNIIKSALERSARDVGLLKRPRTEEEIQEKLRRIDDIVKRSSARPVLDNRHPNEILEYDEWGLPK